MKRIVARFGWIGNMLIVMSMLGLVYSGGNFTHAAELQTASQTISAHDHSDRSSHQQMQPCQGCVTTLDEHQLHCGATLLALLSNIATHTPSSGYDVPAHRVRDLIAHIFTPDPPPPRLA